MCFGGQKSSTVTPTPTYPTRFEYNRPVPDAQRERVAQANTPNAPATTSPTQQEQLGGSNSYG